MPTIVLKSGRSTHVPQRLADALVKAGKAVYEADIAPVYKTRALKAEPVVPNELVLARAAYEAAIGRKPYHGWDADMLRGKIAEAAEEEDAFDAAEADGSPE